MLDIRSDYEQAQERVQRAVKLFMETMTEHPIWDAANDAGIIRIPLYEEDDWEGQPFLSHICPVWTRPRQSLWLSVHLQAAGFAAYPIIYPVVPKGTDRIRVILHAHNTDEQIKGLANCICEWAEEMLQLQRSGNASQVPAAARKALDLAAKERANGTK